MPLKNLEIHNQKLSLGVGFSGVDTNKFWGIRRETLTLQAKKPSAAISLEIGVPGKRSNNRHDVVIHGEIPQSTMVIKPGITNSEPLRITLGAGAFLAGRAQIQANGRKINAELQITTGLLFEVPLSTYGEITIYEI